MKNVTSTEVLSWAENFLTAAEKELTASEIKEQKLFASLVTDPKNKVILTKLLDESSQIRNRRTLSRRMKVIFEKYGVPGFMGKTYEYLGVLFREFGYLFDFVAVPAFKDVLRRETGKIIIKEERPALTRHLKNRWKDDIGQNVNLLGEVVLGDREAERRYHHYLNALIEPDINYISIKISGIYAQLHPLSYEKSKDDLCKLIVEIFRQAIANPYQDHKGNMTPKFVNLDMEEYKDSELTLDVFTTVMAMPEFKDYTAGIVVQAYLPDAIFFYERLLEFAKKRRAGGGAPIKVRLVKGANLQMETIQSSLKGWSNPVLPDKVSVDANYMRLLDLALQPENVEAVHIGVASHNFFTIAYASLLSTANKVEEYVTFEMLEGMANHLPRVMKSLGERIILYTPVVGKEHFLNAVSYLVRRLDENTGKDNFLTYSFNLKIHSVEWDFLKEQFLAAYAMKDHVVPKVFRTQDRNVPPVPQEDIHTFANEADTDLDLAQNREWALNTLNKWETTVRRENFSIPVQIGGKKVVTEKKRKYCDRSRNDEVCFSEVNLSTLEQVNEILKIAEEDMSGWRKTGAEERNHILHQAAEIISARRGEMIGCMSAITGKTFTEGDVEVSEGIDFCRYYPISLEMFDGLESVSHSPQGIVLVIPPWNFPFAIPVGGVAAALTGGNSVILKPATVAFPIAWQFAQCFWEAGVPKDALQVVCPAERSSLNYLTSHPFIKHVILTGGTDTAFKLLENSPRTPLSAETGGKNAIIVTASADYDHAVQSVISSAFSNAGQKCSACSLLILEKSVYNDKVFREKIKDAVTSMHTGSAWQPDTLVGPMITNENDKLLHALENLEEGESWLVSPVFMDKKKYILRPCVKWGVKPGSFSFVNELFAPMLSVVCAENLKEAIKLANSTEYGLTSGLQSLDEQEIALWKNSIEAGNLYINRGITGAIVRRQPFGGMKRSAFGAGIKAGGPNYVSCFINFEEKDLPEFPADAEYPFEGLVRIEDPKELNRLKYAFHSYEKAWKEEFSVERDVSHITGEMNTFRYLPLRKVALYVRDEDNLADVLLCLCAVNKTRTKMDIIVSSANPHLAMLKSAAGACANATLTVETTDEFIAKMSHYDRVRTCSEQLPEAFYNRAAKLGIHIEASKPVVEGRLEILHYLKEQSITYEYHRYGSIIEKPEV